MKKHFAAVPIFALLLGGCGTSKPEAGAAGPIAASTASDTRPEPESSAPQTSTSPSPTSLPATTTPAPTKKPSQPAKPLPPAVACQSRPPASDEILVRSVTTDEPPTVIRLGGGWVWDFGDKKCITSVQMAIMANPMLAGFCTQVALVTTNPGYDEDAIPAPRLKKVIASTGNC